MKAEDVFNDILLALKAIPTELQIFRERAVSLEEISFLLK